MTLERKARVEVDALLAAAGTHVCDMAQANIHPAIGVAFRELPLDSGVGFAGYLFHVNGCSWGLIEARKQGTKVDKGCWRATQDRATRRKTVGRLDHDFEYQPEELGRAVQKPAQMRTMVRIWATPGRLTRSPAAPICPKCWCLPKTTFANSKPRLTPTSSAHRRCGRLR